MEILTQQQKIEAITTMAIALGFKIVTQRQKERYAKLRSINPPNTPRGKQANKRITLKKDIGNLAIYLHIPVDPETKEFVKAGALFWIIVTDSFPVVETKRYYREPLSCAGDFVKRITYHLTAVEACIDNRPVSDLTNPPQAMVPYRDMEGRIWFVARENEKIVDKKKFFTWVPADFELIKYINKWQHNKVAITKRRKKKNSQSASELRQPYTIEKQVGPLQKGDRPNPIQLDLGMQK